MLVAAGSTVITAQKAGTATHLAVTKTYTLTVTSTAVAFSGLSANGISNTVSTTALTLTFNADPTTLHVDDISVMGATKGELTGIGTTRTLAISAITVANGATVTVTLANPVGFTITPASHTVAVNVFGIGSPYQGGIVAYILQVGNPGYDPVVKHGLIAAIADLPQSAWIIGGSTQTTWVNGTGFGGTSYEFGTGQANTNAMMAQVGYTGGAAKLCDDYINTDTGTGVYTDWYLPSLPELNMLYINRIAIGGFSTYTILAYKEEPE